MYDDDDELALLIADEELESPLDRMAPVDEDAGEPKPDPEQMLAFLRSSEANQRMLGARAFCEIQDERAIPYLIALLTDACPLTRVSAAYGLGRNPSPEAVEALIQQYHADWNGYVRKGVVWALGNCRDRRSIPTLIEAIRTDISAVRLWAASSLAQMASIGYAAVIAAVPPLIEALLRDPIPAVRSNCAWSVGELCRELPSNAIYGAAIDALLEAIVEDQDLGVQADARSALLKVGDPRGLQLIEELEQEGFL
jgi:HEAT repeat protein